MKPPLSDELLEEEEQPEPPSRVPRLGPDLRTRRLRTTERLVLYVAGVPSTALLIIGIVVWATGSAARDVVLGILIIGMAATVTTGAVVATILLKREAELARMQSEFVSRVSHDLRTPLTGIKLFVETLQLGRAQDPQTTQECLQALGEETDRLLVMVDRLLSFSRIESARREYTARRINVAVLVERALRGFEPLCLNGNVTLQKSIPKECPDVEVDPDAVVEALLNLLQNAFNYTPPNDKRIGVTVLLRNDKVQVRVADNGPGVEPSERKKIFERFYRGAAARALQVAGTGLGLAVVRAIIRSHYGDVHVEKNEPSGAVFVVVLPIADRPR